MNAKQLPHTPMRRTARLARVALISLVAWVSGATVTLADQDLLVQQELLVEQDPLNHPPGRMVDVGGHRLHLQCEGDRAPTVVVEAGLAGFSLEWRAIQAAVADDLRVCIYDRAGYGWSERGPEPRTVDRIARELDRMLAAAGERPPFILVGHSFGGYVVRYYASQRPESIAGLVFVDASQPEQHALMPISMPSGRGRLHATPVIPEDFPADLETLALRLMLKPGARETQYSELRYFSASAAKLDAVSALPNVPVVVLARAPDQAPRVWDAALRDERIWQGLQASFASRTPGSSYFEVLGAHHHIHLSHPQRVAEAIRGVSMAARFVSEMSAQRFAQADGR